MNNNSYDAVVAVVTTTMMMLPASPERIILTLRQDQALPALRTFEGRGEGCPLRGVPAPLTVTDKIPVCQLQPPPGLAQAGRDVLDGDLLPCRDLPPGSHSDKPGGVGADWDGISLSRYQTVRTREKPS